MFPFFTAQFSCGIFMCAVRRRERDICSLPVRPFVPPLNQRKWVDNLFFAFAPCLDSDPLPRLSQTEKNASCSLAAPFSERPARTFLAETRTYFVQWPAAENSKKIKKRYMTFLLSSKKNYKKPWLRVVSLSILVIWCDPPRVTQNIKWFISHYDFRMGCDPPPPSLFIMQLEGGGGGHTPKWN